MRVRTSGLRAALVLAFLLLVLPGSALAEEPPSAAPGSSPVERVEAFHAVLIDVMKNARTTGVRERFDTLEPAVTGFFHLPLMVKIATGTAWAKGSEEERAELSRAFERMSVATYADRFDGFSGESFATDGTREGQQNTTLVDTKIVRPNDDPIALVYVMRDVEGEWRAIDVLLDTGISELARYRSEYRKILKDGGIHALVAELDSKTDGLLGPKVAETKTGTTP